VPSENLKLLIIGSGGREHALAWKLAQSAKVKEIFCAPGNGGTEHEAKCRNVPIAVMSFEALTNFALCEKIDLVVVGPDDPLAQGIVDHLESAGLRVFGPTKQQAQLEWSKGYAKQFMNRVGVPTPKFTIAHSLEEAKAAVKKNAWARVVKADGLALGKGVFVCDDEKEALAALHEIFEKKAFGTAGDSVVLEERIEGEELSLLMLCDGVTLKILSPCQDHKRRFDGDAGPNTGGMGAYSPVQLYETVRKQIKRMIIEPLMNALATGRLSFKGVLYAGLIVPNGQNWQPLVLEFNARFGDPETQAMMPLLESDLLDLLWACTEERLHEVDLQWSSRSSCCVVAVTETYPTSASRGEPIAIASLPGETFIFHGGTKYESGKLVTDGGRVLAVVAKESNMLAAAGKCYKALDLVSFKGKDYRSDIARRACEKCLSI